MALNKLQQARRAAKTAQQPNAMQILMLVVGAIGLLPALGLALICLVSIMVLTGSNLSAPNPYASSSGGPKGGDVLSAALGGDGSGALAKDQVPNQDLVPIIEGASQECDLVNPAVLAAQIEVESGFDANLVGPDGEQGISQLPPDKFTEYGEDDDDNGKVSALDVKDSIFAQARYLCALGEKVQELLDDQKIIGDLLTLTLLAWDVGLEAVEQSGGIAAPSLKSYPYRVRALLSKYLTGEPESSASARPSGSASGKAPGDSTEPGSFPVTETTFQEMFPGRNPFYSYAGLVDAMKKYPAFAGTGDGTARKREAAAFLANVGHESGGLVYVEEINQAVWGDYCDAAQPYGCPAGQTAYHGRGPIQLSWNSNYKAAGDALGLDLLNEPDLVKNDASVAWQTALWFWMTQNGAGTMTAHSAITGSGGFGETIRTINGKKECNGGNGAQVQSRVDSYRRFAEMLGVEPGDKLTC
jgi:predicted chitinase